MGLKDHLEDGTGHILSLGLDLDYLHVDGALRQVGQDNVTSSGVLRIRSSAPNKSNSCSSSSSGSGSSTSLSTHSCYSSCSNVSEECAISDSEDERQQSGPRKPSQDTSHSQQGESTLDCRAPRLDLVPSRRPEDSQLSVTDHRSKVDFALKLGYSEDLVLLVLRKLGPSALINDILGELVKLGTKTELEHQGGALSQSLASSLASSSSSSSSLGSFLDSCQLLPPFQRMEDKNNLRPVVVDGSNVAMSHGNKQMFSCQGIQLAVDWFLDRGHRDITVFVPAWRKEQSRPDAPISDQEILKRLEREKILVFTPSRRVQGRRVVCYDDRFIVKLAYESDGIIVSNDNYRDLANEKPEWKKFIDERLLMYSFVNDKFMPPDDPLGRHGPSLENFLRKKPLVPEHRKQPCPYGKKCTYGHKCKFYHPERGSQPQRSVADELRASAKVTVASRGSLERTPTMKNQTEGKKEDSAETKRNSKQPSRCPLSFFSDLLEAGTQTQPKAKGSGGIDDGSLSLGYCSHWSSPSAGASDLWEHPATCSIDPRFDDSNELNDSFPTAKSPDAGYISLVKSYPGKNSGVTKSCESLLRTDIRADLHPSESTSDLSDSFSPNYTIDQSPKCQHSHYHHNTSPNTHLSTRVSPGLSQPSAFSYSVPQTLLRPHGFSAEDSFFIGSPHTSPCPLKSSSSCVPLHPATSQLQKSWLSSFPRELAPHSPQTATAQALGSPLRHSTPWKEGNFQDYRKYEGSPLFMRKNNAGLSQQALPPMNWDPKPCHDLFCYKSFPPVHGKLWQSHWSQQTSACGSTEQSLPSLSEPPLSPALPLHSKSQGQGWYEDVRERMFLNLCGIFPPEMVRIVMTNNPHVMDAQELAAAILLEKLQRLS